MDPIIKIASKEMSKGWKLMCKLFHEDPGSMPDELHEIAVFVCSPFKECHSHHDDLGGDDEGLLDDGLLSLKNPMESRLNSKISGLRSKPLASQSFNKPFAQPFSPLGTKSLVNPFSQQLDLPVLRPLPRLKIRRSDDESDEDQEADYDT